MIKMIALVFQGIKCFILYFPSDSTSPHQSHEVFDSDRYIAHPGKMSCFTIGFDFPIFQKVNLQFKMVVTQWRVIGISKTVYDAFLIGSLMNDGKYYGCPIYSGTLIWAYGGLLGCQVHWNTSCII